MEPEQSLKEDWFLWLLLGTALLMVLGYWLVLPSSQSDRKASWLFEDTDPRSLQALRRYDGNRVTYILSRDADAPDWTFSEPAGVEVDHASVERWVKSLLNLEVRRRFETRPDASYGFEASGVRFRVTVNGREHDLFLGGEAPTGRARYLRYGSAPYAPVFLVSRAEVESLDKKLVDLREKEVFDRDAADLTELTISTDEDRVRYRSPGSGEWEIVEPEARALNDTENRKLDDGVSKLLGLRASNFYDTAVPETFRPPRLQLEFSFKDARRTMEIGGLSGNERLLRVENRPVVTVTEDPIRNLGEWPGVPDGILDPAASGPSTVEDTGSSFTDRIRKMKTDHEQPGTDRRAPDGVN